VEAQTPYFGCTEIRERAGFRDIGDVDSLSYMLLVEQVSLQDSAECVDEITIGPRSCDEIINNITN
jgi:hypothetical protein